MMSVRMREGFALLALGLVLAAMSGVASAQVVANPFQTNQPANGIVGGNGNAAGGSGIQNSAALGTGLLGGASTVSPQQLQTIMMLRALQSRSWGRGRVRRGVPQFVPFGAPNFYPNMQGAAQANGQAAKAQAARDAKAEARRQRLIEARKATEEKRRAAREARLANAKLKVGQSKPAKAGDADGN